ncbi:acyl-CoA dehydrogenase family protein [Pseudorhodoferax sp. LjRoot39]|uniref:acyl-CoA dehydrogenase family protein n=1 Tax=Pseudorhodoferax sp. LjRoot39 TaxID=3342328 RepID=UPI003ED05B70
MDDLFTQAVARLLQTHCTPALVRAVESTSHGAALWEAIEETGFANMLATQALGGAELSLRECGPVMALCGEYLVPVPLAETMLARALFSQAGTPWPVGSVAFGAELSPQGNASVLCAQAWGAAAADWVVAPWKGRPCLLPVAEGRVEPIGASLDRRITWPASALRPLSGWPVVDVHALQACAAAAQLAGAMKSVFERTLAYANEREQFGRPIGKFQAIQHQLATMAEHVFASDMAARIGCASSDALPARLQVAVAKARTSEAALEVAAASHAIHGAIGFTAELDLQLYTRRLHAWRHAGGSESYWNDVAGAALCARDVSVLDFLRLEMVA